MTRQDREDARDAAANSDRQEVADGRAATNLDEELRRATLRAEVGRRVLVASVTLLVAVALTLMTVTLVAIRNTQQAGSPTQLALRDQASRIIAQGETIEALARRIKSCTEHNGKCYQAGQKRTSEVVSSLNEVASLAAACAVGYAGLPPGERVHRTKVCVIRFLTTGGGPR